MARGFIMLVLGCVLSGCAGYLGQRNPVPWELLQAAQVPHFVGVRFWGDEVPENFNREFRRTLRNSPRLAIAKRSTRGRPTVNVLALSGGGADGAFGAGVLSGWTDNGDRPEFQVVTGVSAGALSAPFAFLGAEQDHVLREIWTQYGTSQLIRSSGLPGLLGGDSIVDTGPLKDLITRYLSPALLEQIANEYRRGRLLFVLTTNLDAQRPVVWNLGAIAASGHPDAPRLFRDVVLASAALPAIFPPVRIQVTADGRPYDELHVDGGTTREIFIAPIQTSLRNFDQFYTQPPHYRVFLIKNGKLAPSYKPTEQKTFQIAGRAISALLHNQSEGAFYRIYRKVKDARGDFNMISVPVTFPYRPVEAFDKAYQSKLFELGFEMVQRRGAWQKVPPELVPTIRRPAPVATRPVRRAKKDELFNNDSFFGGLESLR